MKTVSAREANQRFSKLLARAAAGEEIVITKRGTPIARLAPVAAKGRRSADDAGKLLLEFLRKGLPLGGVRVNREEIYDRWRR